MFVVIQKLAKLPELLTYFIKPLRQQFLNVGFLIVVRVWLVKMKMHTEYKLQNLVSLC